MSYWRLLKYTAAVLLVGTICFFLGRSLATNWQTVQSSDLKFSYRWLVLGYLPLAVSFVLGVTGWKLILDSLGVVLPWTRSFWTISGSHLAKFVPGHVLALGGRVWLCGREGVPKAIAATGVVIEMIAQLAASTAVFMLHYLSAGRKTGNGYLLAAAAILAALMVVAHPVVLKKAWRYIPKYGRLVEGRIVYSYGKIAVLVAIYIAAWLLQGAGVWCVARSVHPSLPPSAVLATVGAYGGAYALGFISLVAPGGLGVREGVLSYLLSGIMPLPVAIIVAIGTRIWLTIYDVAMTLISLKFYRPGDKNAKA